MDDNNAETLLRAGAASGDIREVGGIPMVLVPRDYAMLSLEKHLAAPKRKSGVIAFEDAVSFARYIETHADDRTILLIATNPNGASFEAVFDYHSKEQAGWKEHRARFALRQTVEWTRWINANGKKLTQQAFAEFLEENQAQIVTPSGAEMLEIATRLEATTSVAFVSGVKLQNGNQELRYEETTEAKAGTKGSLQVPTSFTIGLALFEGSAAYSITARLRYRIENKELKLWYDLLNPHLVIKDAVETVSAEITNATGLKPYKGSL